MCMLRPAGNEKFGVCMFEFCTLFVLLSYGKCSWCQHIRMDFIHIAALGTLFGLLLSWESWAVKQTATQYSRQELLDFACKAWNSSGETKAKRRKRGKRGGIRLRFRKQHLDKIPLPSVSMGNVRSLRHKLDELQGIVCFPKDYKDCCVLAFTETWFTERDQDTELAIDGFGAPLHLDRDTATGQLKMHTNPSHSPRWAQRIITVCIYSHFIKKKRKL